MPFPINILKEVNSFLKVLENLLYQKYYEYGSSTFVQQRAIFTLIINCKKRTLSQKLCSGRFSKSFKFRPVVFLWSDFTGGHQKHTRIQDAFKMFQYCSLNDVQTCVQCFLWSTDVLCVPWACVCALFSLYLYMSSTTAQTHSSPSPLTCHW